MTATVVVADGDDNLLRYDIAEGGLYFDRSSDPVTFSAFVELLVATARLWTDEFANDEETTSCTLAAIAGAIRTLSDPHACAGLPRGAQRPWPAHSVRLAAPLATRLSTG